jgi:hypothetical protein
MPLSTPSELFHDWLAKRPADARIAVVIDSDRFLGDAGLLDKATLVDLAAREWQLALFTGQDLEFRCRFREAFSLGRTVIVLSRGPYSTEPIDVSYIADVLTLNESGDPLDLSVPAFFHRITPKIDCPVRELRRFKADLLSRLDFAQEAAEKLIEKWGKPDSWSRGQVAAMVLLAHHPELSLKDIWTDETEPTQFLAHVVRLLVGSLQLANHREVILQIIRETARDQVKHVLFWTETELDQLAGYLVLRKLAGQLNLQNPSNQLAGLQIFPADLPLAEMEKLTPGVIAVLQKDGTWPAVEQQAETFLTPARAAKVVTVLPPMTGTDKDAALLLAQRVPAILRQHLLSALDTFFKKPSAQALAWVPPLENHPILSDAEVPTDRSRQCRAGLRLLLALQRAEAGLALSLPEFPHADALLDWHIHNGQHLLELEVSQAAHCLAEFDEDALTDCGHQYLYGADEQRPASQSLKGRVFERVERLDAALAAFVRPDPDKFCHGARSASGFLREKIPVDQIAADTLPGRVWVLIFDGMRFDSWEHIVRPILAEFFQVQDRPCFCLLPSYTEIARTGLLAGATPSEWKGLKGAFSLDEAQLFAVNMGLTAQEAKTKLRYVTGADTTKARKKLTFTDNDAPLLNVLVYPISDEEAHDFDGDLAALNSVIRTKMLGDKATGIRGVLDDLLKRIGPDDVVVLSSDHGFKELLDGEALTVTDAEAAKAGRTPEDSIRWRYVEGFAPAAMPDAIKVPVVTQDVWMAVGRRWLMREATKAIPRYSHGGLSLAEIVVPAATLRRVAGKAAQAELLNLPTILQADEDTEVELAFTVKNAGNCDIEFEVRVADNLGKELLQHRAHLAPATSAKLTASVFAEYRQTPARETDPSGTVSVVTLRLRHTDLDGTWREALDGYAAIPVKITPKTVKFETDALKGFDDV